VSHPVDPSGVSHPVDPSGVSHLVGPSGVSHPVDLHPLDSSGVGVHRICRSAQCQRMSQKVINFGGRILVSSIYVRTYISGGEVKALANCPVIYICGVNSSSRNFLKYLSVRKGSEEF